MVRLAVILSRPPGKSLYALDHSDRQVLSMQPRPLFDVQFDVVTCANGFAAFVAYAVELIPNCQAAFVLC